MRTWDVTYIIRRIRSDDKTNWVVENMSHAATASVSDAYNYNSWIVWNLFTARSPGIEQRVVISSLRISDA